jgi:hypothetical protein
MRDAYAGGCWPWPWPALQPGGGGAAAAPLWQGAPAANAVARCAGAASFGLGGSGQKTRRTVTDADVLRVRVTRVRPQRQRASNCSALPTAARFQHRCATQSGRPRSERLTWLGRVVPQARRKCAPERQRRVPCPTHVRDKHGCGTRRHTQWRRRGCRRRKRQRNQCCSARQDMAKNSGAVRRQHTLSRRRTGGARHPQRWCAAMRQPRAHCSGVPCAWGATSAAHAPHAKAAG